MFQLQIQQDLDKLIRKLEDSKTASLISIISIAGFLIYIKILFNGFVWDDEDQIVNNLVLRNLGNFWYFFTHSTFYTGGAQAGLSGLYYRPFMSVVFSLLWRISGSNAFLFHLFDLLIHLANSIIIFFLIKNLLKHGGYKFSQTVGFFSSLLFLVHPTNVESVAYISATSELLYTFFLLNALILTLSFVKFGSNSFLKLVGIGTCILLSLFSKESGAISLVLIFLVVIILFRKKRSFLLIIPSTFAAIIYCIFRFVLAHLSAPENTSIMPIASASLYERLLTIPYEISSYFRIIFFPKNLHISQADIVKNMYSADFYIPLIICGIILICGLSLLLYIKSKLTLFFTLWFVLSLGIVVNIIPLDFTIAERWLYVPLIGFLGLFAILISKILENQKTFKTYFVVIFFFIILFFAYRTFYRTFNWESPIILFGHDIKLSKNSAELHTNYGTALYKVGNYKESKKEYEYALALVPDNLWAINNLGSIYAQLGNYEKAKPLFLRSIQIAPTYASYENLAQIYVLTQDKEALHFTIHALKLFPNSARLNQLAALLYLANGDQNKARIMAKKSANIDPSFENTNPIQELLK